MEDEVLAASAAPDAPAALPRFMRTGLGILILAALCLMLALDAAWEAGFVYAAVGVVIVTLCMDEYARLAEAVGVHVARAALVYGGAALFLLQWAGWVSPAFPNPWLSALAVSVLIVMGLLSERVLRAQVEGTLETAGAHALGLLYVPVLMGFLTAVRVEWGVAGLITVVAVCKSGSSGAYFIGKNFGRVRLSPRVSPRKTVEGAVGAFGTAMAVALALSYSPWALMGPKAALAYGAVVALAGILGDLTASLLKRQAGLKDSGRLLPGLGGMLDMVDDVLFAAPVSFVFLRVCELLPQGG